MKTRAIRARKTRGTPPSWLFGHSATLEGDSLLIRGGQEQGMWKDRQHLLPNFDEYRLDLKSWTWSKLTDHRDWRHYRITPSDWSKTPWAEMQDLRYVPPECEVSSLEPFHEVRLRYAGVLVVVEPGVKGDAKITMQGKLSDRAARAYVKWVVAHTSQLLGAKFKVEDVSKRRKAIFGSASGG